MKNRIDTTDQIQALRPGGEQQQLDLSFLGGCRTSPAFRRRQRLAAHAKGWFDLMRRVVDCAVEWKPAPPPRAEQTALDLRRDTEVIVK